MNIDLFFDNLKQKNTFSFASLQKDYGFSSVQSFNLITQLVENKMLKDENGIFIVTVSDVEIENFKSNYLEPSEYQSYSETSEDNDSSIKGSCDGKYIEQVLQENEEEKATYYDIGYNEKPKEKFNCAKICELWNGKKFRKLPKNTTIYITAYGAYKHKTIVKMDIRHSFKQFIENLVFNDIELLKKFFIDNEELQKFLFDRKFFDIKSSEFSCGNLFFLVDELKWNKPLIKQPKAYFAILDALQNDEDVYLDVALKCKDND